MGGVKGPIGEIRAFAKQVGGLKEAGRTIAKVAAPKIALRANLSIRLQETPYGVGWVPSKSSGAVLQGATSQIFVSLQGGGKTIRVSLAYPLGFHNDGTHAVGKKRGAAIRRKLVGASVRLAVAAYGKAPKKRKDETEDEYDTRMAHLDVIRSVKSETRQKAKREVAAAIVAARASGGIHDPKRPIIPNEGEGIPAAWSSDVLDAAREVMAKGGAELRGG